MAAQSALMHSIARQKSDSICQSYAQMKNGPVFLSQSVVQRFPYLFLYLFSHNLVIEQANKQTYKQTVAR